MQRLKQVLSLILIVSFLPGCASVSESSFENDAGFGNQEGPGLSRRDHKEIQAGEEIHREIISSFSVYTEPNANAYVKEITRMIGKVSNRPGLPYECTILFSDKIYSTSAPGGHVYITTGFINILDNESELASVIAHEVAQVQYQTPKYSDAKKALQAAETVAGIAGGFFGGIGMVTFLGIATLNAMTDEKTVQQRIVLADRKALAYMVKAGYDPQGYVDVLYKIIYADASLMPYLIDYYNSRPVNATRINQVNKMFKVLKLENKNFDTHREKFIHVMTGVKQLYQAPPQ